MPVHRHPVAVHAPGDPLNPLPLDRDLIANLKETYDIVRTRGPRLAELFYSKLFTAAPQLRPLFRSAPAAQSAKLLAALDFVVKNFEAPEANITMLASLGKRHAGYGAKPEHYGLVIDLLIESMSELLGHESTKKRLDEWRLALGLISSHMIAAAEAASGHTPSKSRIMRPPSV